MIFTAKQKRNFQNCVALRLKSESGESQMLNLYYPTSEAARCAVVFLRRCLMYQSYEIDLKSKSPDGFISLYRDGPSCISMSDGKFAALKEIREESAVGRMQVRIFRDARFGGDMSFTMYFYGRLDMHMAYMLIELGVGELWTQIACEVKDSTMHVWRSCDVQGMCDRGLAAKIGKLCGTQKDKLNKFISLLLEEDCDERSAG